MLIDPQLSSPDAIDVSPRAADEMLEKLIAQQPPELAIYAGGEHSFNLFPMPLGAAALRRGEAFSAEALAGETK